MKKAFGAAVLCAVMAVPASAQAADTFNSKPYRKAVTVNNMLVHSRALQRIADANGHTRAAGTPGNEATVNYVFDRMKAQKGWKVEKAAVRVPVLQQRRAVAVLAHVAGSGPVRERDGLRDDDLLGLG